MTVLDEHAMRQDGHLGEQSVYSCPACGDRLAELQEGGLIVYRCAIGHAYSVHTLLLEQSEALKKARQEAQSLQAEVISLSKRIAQGAKASELMEAALWESEARHTFLLKLSDELRSLTDPVQIQSEASRLLGEHLGVDRVGYAETEPDGESMVVAHDWTSPGTSSSVGKYQIDAFGTYFTTPLRAGGISTIEDALNDPRVFRETYASTWGQIDARSAIAYSLVKHGRFIGVIFIHQHDPRHWLDSEVALVVQVAERIWTEIERARAEQSLRTNEAKYRALFEEMEEGYIEYELVHDAEGHPSDLRIIELNRAFTVHTKLSREHCIGQLRSEAIPGPQAETLTTYVRALETGDSIRFERYQQAFDRWYDLRVYPRSANRFAVIYDDITDRKRGEKALREREERLRGQKEAFQAAINGAPLTDSLNLLARMVIEATAGEARTAFYIADPDGTCLHPIWGAGNMSESYAKQIDRFPIGKDSLSCGLALATGRPVVSRDVAEVPEWTPWVHLANENGFRGCWSFPIETRDGKPIGTFAMYFREPRDAVADDFALADVVTQAAGIIISRHTEAQERRCAEEALLESQKMLQSFYDTAPFMLGIGEMDSDQLIAVSANRMTAEFFARSAEAIPGKTGAELGTLQNIEALWLTHLHMSQQRDAPVRFEYEDSRLPEKPWLSATVAIIGTGASGRPQYSFIAENITDRKRIEAAEREQRLLAEVLRDTALTLTSSFDFSEVTQHILVNIGGVVPHDAASLLMIEGSQASVVRAMGYGQFGETLETDLQDFSVGLDESDRIIQMLQTQRPILIPIWENHGVWDQVPGMEAMRSLVAAPILDHDTVIGFLKLYSRRTNFFTPAHVALLQVFAAQAALGLRNARAYKEGQTLAVRDERHRLARDLHDAVTQTLFSANMIADALLHMPSGITDPVKMQLQQLQMLTHGALAEMRTLLLELRPEALVTIDLETQIGQLLDALKVRKRIDVTFTSSIDPMIPPLVRVAFYRIAQEALNNVVKHSRATEVRVILHNEAALLELVIQDNGLGFESGEKHSGLGLNIMSERADEIGADFTVITEAGAGTRVCVSWGDKEAEEET